MRSAPARRPCAGLEHATVHRLHREQPLGQAQ
jgi:hypothetical protein